MEQTKKMMMLVLSVVVLLSILKTTSSACVNSFSNIPFVPLTLVQNDKGAVCLDGSPPSYYHDLGDDIGKNNWVIYLEGGGWCSSVEECNGRLTSRYGSSKYAPNTSQFGHILSRSSKYNPDFCSWNRVRINYCDGSSFTGDVETVDPATNLTYRGGRIFKVIMEDLLSKGMKHAENAILSGSSAGGLATIIHCDRFRSLLPSTARVKCLCDSGYFMSGTNLMGDNPYQFERTFEGLITLQGSSQMLPSCVAKSTRPSLCFFPQYSLPYVKTPLFIIMSSFDKVQVLCNLSLEHMTCLIGQNCSRYKMAEIEELRLEFLATLPINVPSSFRGIWITSCITHVLLDNGWIPPRVPINSTNLKYSQLFADWYFDRMTTNVIDLSNVAKICDNAGIRVGN